MILTVYMGKGKYKVSNNENISTLHHIDKFPTNKKLDTNNYFRAIQDLTQTLKVYKGNIID